VRLDAQGFTEPLERVRGAAVGSEQRLAQTPGDGRNLNDVSGLLAPHGGQDRLAHGDVTEEISLELMANLVEVQVVAESSDAESCIVNQHFNAAVVFHKYSRNS